MAELWISASLACSGPWLQCPALQTLGMVAQRVITALRGWASEDHPRPHSEFELEDRPFPF